MFLADKTTTSRHGAKVVQNDFDKQQEGVTGSEDITENSLQKHVKELISAEGKHSQQVVLSQMYLESNINFIGFDSFLKELIYRKKMYICSTFHLNFQVYINYIIR